MGATTRLAVWNRGALLISFLSYSFLLFTPIRQPPLILLPLLFFFFVSLRACYESRLSAISMCIKRESLVRTLWFSRGGFYFPLGNVGRKKITAVRLFCALPSYVQSARRRKGTAVVVIVCLVFTDKRGRLARRRSGGREKERRWLCCAVRRTDWFIPAAQVGRVPTTGGKISLGEE